MLLEECEQAGVSIKTKCDIQAIARQGSTYSLKTSLGSYQCQSLVIATGGLSIPTMGATGFGYEIAAQFGLNLLPRIAGLVPFTFTDWVKDISERLSGLAVDMEMPVDGTTFRENLPFTNSGVRAPPPLMLSSYLRPGPRINTYLLLQLQPCPHLLSHNITLHNP